QAGLTRSQLTGKAALAGAVKVAEALRRFADEAQLDLPDLAVPDEWSGVAEFDRAAKRLITQMRGQVPGIREQQGLLARQRELLAVKTGFESLRKQWDDLRAKCRTLDKEHGGRVGVDAKIADAAERLQSEQQRLRQTNGRAAVLHEAVVFLERVA